MSKLNIFRYAIIVIGALVAFRLTVLPMLMFTLINPAKPYQGRPELILAELPPALIGMGIIFLPFVIFWFATKNHQKRITTTAGVLLLLASLGGFIFMLQCGDPQCGIAYMFYVLPLQYLAVPIGLLIGKIRPDD